MLSEQLIFILDNVKGLQGGDKKIEFFEYVKTCIHFNGYFFVTGNTLILKRWKKWPDELQRMAELINVVLQ